jgi:DNA-binding beta-propeller fold protein YncE
MWLRRFNIVFGAFAVALLVGCQGQGKHAPSSASSASSSPSGEILYVLDNVSVTTYAIDPSTLEPSVAGGPVGLIPTSSFLLQFVPSPDDHFLYVLWSDTQQQEHLSAFTTDLSGVPQIPPVQILDVSSLSQLNIHPSGEFAYAMELDNSTGAYISKILLFHTNAYGILQLDSGVQGIYGPALFPTLLSGVSPDGTQLYLTSEDANGPVYWERTVNEQNGTLAADVILFRPPIRDSVALGATLVIDYQNTLNYSQPGYVNILSNEPEPPQQLIHCTSAMLGACGTATNVQLDPSGKYLFLTDPASQQVRVARIDFPANAITDTGHFLSFTAQTPGFAFSPDGTLVYALLASDSSLHVYRFDQTSGNLMEGSTSIPMPNSAGFSPALRR